MEYGIWNFHGGLWTANNLAAFNGTTLTPITAATLPTNTSSFAITAGLLNPIITAAAACNLNVNETNDNTINTQHSDIISEQNSEDSNSSQFTTCNDEDNDGSNNNNESIDNATTNRHSSEFITSDLTSSNSCDDNAVDNQIKISNNHQIHGYLAQQYAPVYNLVLGHFGNQNIEASETDESSDDENTNTTTNNENLASNDNNNYTKSILNDQQPSVSYETPTNTVTEQFTNNGDVHKCPVTGCEYKTTHIELLEQHVATHGEKAGKNKKVSNMQRIRYEREEYHCSMCSYTCTTEKAYLRHLRMHSLGEAPHGRLSCAVCGRDRVGETAMAKHMKKHRDDRYFCCDICVFRTVQLKKLIQHRRMHTGEKPHLCPHCAYRSARRDNLRSHVRRVHKRDNLWCDTFSPRGMLLTPSASKTNLPTNKDSETSLPSTETKTKVTDK